MDSLRRLSFTESPVDSQLLDDIVVSSEEEATRTGSNYSSVGKVADGQEDVRPEIQRAAEFFRNKLKIFGIHI